MILRLRAIVDRIQCSECGSAHVGSVLRMKVRMPVKIGDGILGSLRTEISCVEVDFSAGCARANDWKHLRILRKRFSAGLRDV